MNRVAALLTCLALAGCNRPAPPQVDGRAAAGSPAVNSDRCARGGMDAANDPSCKAAADQRFKQFMDGGGDEHRRR